MLLSSGCPTVSSAGVGPGWLLEEDTLEPVAGCVVLDNVLAVTSSLAAQVAAWVGG